VRPSFFDVEEPKVPVTRRTLKQIMDLQSPRGGWSRSSLASLGVPWPAPKGWKQALLQGKSVPIYQPSKPRKYKTHPHTWDGTRIVMIDRSYPEAIKRERARYARASLPKAERRMVRALVQMGFDL